MSETLGEQLLRERREDREAAARDADTDARVDRVRRSRETAQAVFYSLLVAGGVGTIASLVHGIHKGTKPAPAPVERHGGHHGSTQTPSQEQLNKLARERGITFNHR